MITRPKLIATPTWPSAELFASTMIAPQPAKTRANVPTSSARALRHKRRSVTRSLRGEDAGTQAARASQPASCRPRQGRRLDQRGQPLHRLAAYAEVGERSPLLPIEQPRLAQHLQVVADRRLGELELVG